MEFDLDGFRKAKLKPRTAMIHMPGLPKKFFKGLKKGEKPFWEVRGLNAIEMARVKNAEETSRNIKAIIENLLSGDPKLMADAVANVSGISDNVPGEIVRRMELLYIGCINPELDRNNRDALQIAQFSNDFYAASNKILELTGMGPILGE